MSISGPVIYPAFRSTPLQFLSGDCGGLVIRSRLRGLGFPEFNLDFTEDPPCIGPVARYWPNVLPLVWCGSLERGGSSGTVLVIWSRFKIKRPIPK
ncbi:hypothetical protein AVEN_25971-1 [Araneus ventricosus]|uniref:Uncharacterized protein n=1 Tax=Araneus ventricosus TaxID=182803 RepID=A0A4Y2FKJ5_ARAVE|nr:hypothetical protein AVEN_25971-1 [Araneus ventricosus]